jgi:hypothetical protein
MEPEERERRITELLPDTLDFMADYIEQGGWSIIDETGSRLIPMMGCDIITAIDVVQHQEDHELAQVFRDVKIAISIGMEEATALRHAADRAQVPEFTAVAEAIIQTMQVGGDMTTALRDEAKRIRALLGGLQKDS